MRKAIDVWHGSCKSGDNRLQDLMPRSQKMFTNLFLVVLLFSSSTAVSAIPTESADIYSLNQEVVYEGNVSAVEADSVSLIIKKDESTVKFLVKADTKITRNGKPAALSTIQVSDFAKITIMQDGRKMVAKMITANASE